MTARRQFVKITRSISAIHRSSQRKRRPGGIDKKDHAMSTQADTSAVTAIDILLEPDATMLQHAQTVNDRLLKVFP